MTRVSAKAAALGLGLFALGVVVGVAGPALWGSLAPRDAGDDAAAASRDALARTAALTTSQTLIAMPRDAVGLKADAAAALQRVGLTVAPEKLVLPGRALMKAELFHFGDGPVAQFVWLDEQSGAVSLFVTPRQGSEAAPVPERRGDMNTLAWATPGHRFTLAGLAPEEILSAVARDLAPRLAQ